MILVLIILVTIAPTLFALVNVYMKLNIPVLYSKDTLNNSPLNNLGDDFPYKQHISIYNILKINNIEVGIP